MFIYDFIMNAFRFIPVFWEGVYQFFTGITLPGPLQFLDVTTGPTLFVVIKVIIYFAIYLLICKGIYKLILIPFQLMNEHMYNFNMDLYTNSRFYFAAIILMCLDAFHFSVVGRSEGEGAEITMFFLIAMLLVLIGIVRLLFKCGLRVIYIFPMQVLRYGIYYVLLLIFFPVIVMLLLAAGAGAAASGGGKVCGYCKKNYIECTCNVDSYS